MSPRAAIVYLGRDVATGEARAVDKWRRLLGAVGAEVVDIPLLDDHPATPWLRWGDLPRLARGDVVPEALAWSPDSASRRIRSLDVDLVVAMTARAYHPKFVGVARLVVLDYCDSLARSYSGRAGIVSGLHRKAGYLLLGRAHQRFEKNGPPEGVVATACGRSDAASLGVQWVPNLASEFDRVDPAAADRDVLFVGNLGYPPNEAAVERLGRIWPAVLELRPATTALIAGRRPTERVRRVAERHGWEVFGDFSDVRALYSRARVAVAPMDHVAGISNKVLDAAQLGLAQVTSPDALAGLDPDFPVTVATDDASFAGEIVALLADDDRRLREADYGRHHVRKVYGIEAWIPWARDLLEIGEQPACERK
jgi:glycosyltransferase involved in cell wall biosynthesis